MSEDWAEDCSRWRGRVLIGKYAHWCADWDFLPIDETCPEWPCACEDELKKAHAAIGEDKTEIDHNRRKP